MKQVLPDNYQKLLVAEKEWSDDVYPGQKKAWGIIDKNRAKINLDSPFKSILNL